jgi:peptidoglycan/xylan/chitin deacetylase (PgdA/CDA1 family)
MVFSCSHAQRSNGMLAMIAGLRKVMLALAALYVWLPAPTLAQPSSSCPAGTLYLTIDTGWGREADKIAEILRRHGIRATLFVAHEPTHRGDRSLDPGWAAFWRARAREGHVFASHTDRHWYFRGDPARSAVRYVARSGGGEAQLDQEAMCRELAAPLERLRTAAPEAVILPLWRAPGGITTPNALRLAEGCGLRHQGWTKNGFLGDELNSDTHPNAMLRDQALRNIRDGEVLVMHWGVRSRKVPYANILEDVLTGLQSKGFCFAPLTEEGRR